MKSIPQHFELQCNSVLLTDGERTDKLVANVFLQKLDQFWQRKDFRSSLINKYLDLFDIKTQKLSCFYIARPTSLNKFDSYAQSFTWYGILYSNCIAIGIAQAYLYLPTLARFFLISIFSFSLPTLIKFPREILWESAGSFWPSFVGVRLILLW